MNNYKIVTDTACDLSVDFLNQNQIPFVPFSVTFNDRDYFKEHIDISVDDFLEKLKNDGVFAKTSLPSIGNYTDVFEKFLEEGKDILCICISSKLSGSYQSACNAAEILKEEYPEREIKVIDSTTACAGQGFILRKALENLSNGISLEDNFEILELLKERVKILFTVDELSYLQKGGRLNATSAFVGNVLDIKPILAVDEGIIKPVNKIRKLKKTVNYLVQQILDAKEKSPNGIEVVLINSGLDEALEMLIEELNKNKITPTYPTSYIGVTISAHIGTGACGVVIYSK